MGSPSPSSSEIQVIYENIKVEPENPRSQVERDKEFTFLHGNIRLRVGGTEFVIHSYQLENFERIVSKLPPRQTFVPRVITLEGDPDDFRNTLRVLYAKPYGLDAEEEAFDTQILKSTLKVSTEYKNAALRTFCIREFGKKDLALRERLGIAKEFNISGWRDQIADDLVARDLPISAEEIELLGAEQVASIVARWGSRLMEGGIRASKRVRIATGKSKAMRK